MAKAAVMTKAPVAVAKTKARTISPLGDRVVVKPSEAAEEMRGGIYIPDTAKEKPQEGEVVAVGPGHVNDNGDRAAMELKVGDKIIYAKYGGTEIKEDGQDYLILRETDVLAKLNRPK